MGKKKILIVDDDQDTLDLLELFLYKDYDVTAALNGYEALTLAEKEQPDLIMTDITMPEMDGIRFFNQISKSENIRRAPIVAVTSYEQENTRGSLLNMGFYGVVPKPVERAALMEIAAKALGEDGQGET